MPRATKPGQVGLAGIKLVPPAPLRFAQFAAAGAGETISLPTATAAAARMGHVDRRRRERARQAAGMIWDSIAFARPEPFAELPFLACWLENNGGIAGEIDYYCESLHQARADRPGDPDLASWDHAKVARWLGLGSMDDYFKRVPPFDLAEAIALAWRSQEEKDEGFGDLPEPLARELAADALDAGSILEGGIRLVNLPREAACEFIRKHHSALPNCNLRGLMFALGAVVPDEDGDPILVAVATAGTPTGGWDSGGCSKHGTLELTRVAAIGGIKTRDRRGQIRPLAASSKLTSRIMDLLPESGREGEPGCRFVTYSLDSEQGTTYLSLAAKGLRPVQYNKGKRPTGARAKAGPQALGHVNKVVWEAGPAARPPVWKLVPPAQREGGRRGLAQFMELSIRRLEKPLRQLERKEQLGPLTADERTRRDELQGEIGVWRGRLQVNARA